MNYDGLITKFVNNPYVLLTMVIVSIVSAYGPMKSTAVATSTYLKSIYRWGVYRHYQRARRASRRMAFHLVKRRGVLLNFRIWMLTRLVRSGFLAIYFLVFAGVFSNFSAEGAGLAWVIILNAVLSLIFFIRFQIDAYTLTASVSLANKVHDRLVARRRLSEIAL